MTIFMDMLLELLPLNSELQKPNNPLRKVLDKSIGEYFDNIEPIYEQLFLTTATGGWLDAHGEDYGVPRQPDEDDEHYRQRIIYEKLDILTVGLLYEVYGLDLYAFVPGFNPKVNQLTSDNPYISNRYMSIADESTRDILNNKFILDSGIVWLDETSFVNPNKIINVNGMDVLYNYLDVFSEVNTDGFFAGNREIKEMVLILDRTLSCEDMFNLCHSLTSLDLNLPNATECNDMLMHCYSLTTLNLDLPNAIHCGDMMWGCSSLSSLNLNLPKASKCGAMLSDCSSLSSIDLDLPNATTCGMMLKDCSSLTTINLNLPNAIRCDAMLMGCSSLLSIDLYLPKATDCNDMFINCLSLVNVKLNLPKLERYANMFFFSSNIETIDVTIPTNIVTGFKSMVQDCELTNLTSFKINGEEQL